MYSGPEFNVLLAHKDASADHYMSCFITYVFHVVLSFSLFKSWSCAQWVCNEKILRWQTRGCHPTFTTQVQLFHVEVHVSLFYCFHCLVYHRLSVPFFPSFIRLFIHCLLSCFFLRFVFFFYFFLFYFVSLSFLFFSRLSSPLLVSSLLFLLLSSLIHLFFSWSSSYLFCCRSGDCSLPLLFKYSLQSLINFIVCQLLPTTIIILVSSLDLYRNSHFQICPLSRWLGWK